MEEFFGAVATIAVAATCVLLVHLFVPKPPAAPSSLINSEPDNPGTWIN